MSDILGNIEVTIIEGRNFKSADWFGKNDPWCELTIDGKLKKKTAVKVNTNEPVWDETFSFPISPGQSNLSIKVYDKDFFSSDSLGALNIDLKQVFEKDMLHGWLGLTDKNPGELNLFLRWIPKKKLVEG
ncbi:C2 domain-containing protein [Jimgerdemannia flammicorona]|uniref:C2 domain-containing protein n=1 Tax=Jimgerdemannia flammicorona TaxID=994334 RepID=A0A433Q6W2_9FUNG|nr:C2 domain-containing protein [Jimgerdemannia flammicorona]